MKTTFYWSVQHMRRAVVEFWFQAECWWLWQQVEFLEWRLRLHALVPVLSSKPSGATRGTQAHVGAN